MHINAISTKATGDKLQALAGILSPFMQSLTIDYRDDDYNYFTTTALANGNLDAGEERGYVRQIKAEMRKDGFTVVSIAESNTDRILYADISEMASSLVDSGFCDFYTAQKKLKRAVRAGKLQATVIRA